MRSYALTHYRYWHQPDHQRCPQFGHYRGESGHGANGPIRSRLTKLRHPTPWYYGAYRD